MPGWEPEAFISHPIEVEFDKPPVLSKKPHAPSAFVWQGQRYQVQQLLAQWSDFERKGDMARNMQPAHLQTAAARGSWGVGRFYFRLQTSQQQAFDVYYDRAPEEAGDRAGRWFLWRSLRRD